MKVVHIAPIEPFEERYSSDWLRWFPQKFRDRGWTVDNVMPPDWSARERHGGAWLDPLDTWEWKGAQVAELARCWRAGMIADGDWILVTDGWGPMLTAAAYLRDTTGVRVRLAGFWHAGTFDPADYLSRTNVARWGAPYEVAALAASDLAFVGSQWAVQLLRSRRPGGEGARPVVTGYPIHRAEILWRAELTEADIERDDRPLRVVFPHRLDAEKRPEDFAELRDLFDQTYPGMRGKVEWVRSRDCYTDKPSYYRLLASSRVAFSAATQETFGIAMQEAAALGCYLVAPDRCSYPEVVRGGSGTCYASMMEAVRATYRYLTAPKPAKWDGYHEHAIGRLIKAMETAL